MRVCGWLCDVFYVWFGYFCDCGCFCGIVVESFEDEEADKSEKKYRRVRLFKDDVFGYMLSDASV